MLVNADTLSPHRAYHLLIQALVPRPIAWVLTDNGDSTLNLAPFSFFNAVCSDPPLLMLSIGRKPDDSPKDTRLNIAERSHFVVHIPYREQAFDVSESSRSLPHGDSELTRLGLQVLPFGDFPLPRLADCRVAFACERYRIEEIGTRGQQMLVFGRVRQVYLDDALVQQDAAGRLAIDPLRLDPLGRLGSNDYSYQGGVITIPRPD